MILPGQVTSAYLKTNIVTCICKKQVILFAYMKYKYYL
jgi:hypothetical protein